MPDLNPYQFRVQKNSIEAFAGDEYVGHVEWEHDPEVDPPGTAFVGSIHVHEGHRRRGVATEMMRRMPVTPTYAKGGEEVGNTEVGGKFLAAWERRQKKAD